MHLNNQYAVLSLELHLFFARIMKEHSLFLKAGFTPVGAAFIKEAEFYKNEFENVLMRAVRLGDGIIRCNVLNSGELFTEFTSRAEQQTERFTGISINRSITSREMWLRCGDGMNIGNEKCRAVGDLNRYALRCLNGLISLKERALNRVLNCQMFTMNYPLLIEHITREAKLYRSYLLMLENDGNIDNQSMREVECFWNQIMMEHALFIRGLLDPSENELIVTADGFAKDYERLLANCREAHDKTITDGDCSALDETLKFRDFKTAGAKGIEECKIRSVILPLLADHVLREANHYIRILKN